MLVRHFADVMRARDGLPAREFTPQAMARLQELEWSGNVRELRNTVERLLILAGGERIGREDLDLLVTGRSNVELGFGLPDSKTFSEFKERSERLFLLQKLREHDWNVSETARILDMPRSNLYKKIERYGLRREE
jgi:two-component system nitrogen regulation response regulator NtrX